MYKNLHTPTDIWDIWLLCSTARPTCAKESEKKDHDDEAEEVCIFKPKKGLLLRFILGLAWPGQNYLCNFKLGNSVKTLGKAKSAGGLCAQFKLFFKEKLPEK